MDSKTKALLKQAELHAAGTVTTSGNPASGEVTITIHPPSMSMQVSMNMIVKGGMGTAEGIANLFGKKMGYLVEQQVLSVIDEDPNVAKKLIYQDKVEKMNNYFAFAPDPAKPIGLAEGVTVNLSPPPSIDEDWKPIFSEYLSSEYLSHWGSGPGVFLSGGTHDYPAVFIEDQGMSLVPKLSVVPELASAVNGSEVSNLLDESIPGFHEMIVTCPGCNVTSVTTGNLTHVIICLNDTHQWTREAIADWLDTLDFDLTIQFPEQEEVKNDSNH